MWSVGVGEWGIVCHRDGRVVYMSRACDVTIYISYTLGR